MAKETQATTGTLSAKHGADENRIRDLVQKKYEISLRIRELKTEFGKLNVDLAKAGAGIAEISCW